MRWFLSRTVVLRLRESLLASKRHLFSSPHRSGGTLISLATAGSSKPALFQWKCSLKGHTPFSAIATYSTSIHTSHEQGTTAVDIEIISKENVQPASPTPLHLRNHRLSRFDQSAPNIYPSFVFFFSNNQKTLIDDVISERRQRLKQSLSETLVSFYPLAGKIKGNLHIDCNDDGVYYVEARANIQLSDFLRMPERDLTNRLLAFNPSNLEILSQRYMLMVQVSIFDCGGIAIGLNASHKIFDGMSLAIFMKAWAATTRKSSEQIRPSFISGSLFPPIPNFSEEASFVVPNSQMNTHVNYANKRFVFDSSALDALKTKAATSSSGKPSSVKAVMGLLWKSSMAASKARCGIQKKSLLIVPVSLRSRCSPPLPSYSFGNLVFGATAQCEEDSNQELEFLVNKIGHAVATVNTDLIENMKCEDRIFVAEQVYSDSFIIASTRKAGYYEADFGWGKPLWIRPGDHRNTGLPLGNFAILMDTQCGDGIEAWVELQEEDMAIFDKNPELLAFASVNPSPLGS